MLFAAARLLPDDEPLHVLHPHPHPGGVVRGGLPRLQLVGSSRQEKGRASTRMPMAGARWGDWLSSGSPTLAHGDVQSSCSPVSWDIFGTHEVAPAITASRLQHLRIALVLVVLAATGARQLVARSHWHARPGAHASVCAPHMTVARRRKRAACCAMPPRMPAPPRRLRHCSCSRPPTHRFVHSASYHEADVPAVPAHAWQSRGPPAA